MTLKVDRHGRIQTCLCANARRQAQTGYPGHSGTWKYRLVFQHGFVCFHSKTGYFVNVFRELSAGVFLQRLSYWIDVSISSISWSNTGFHGQSDELGWQKDLFSTYIPICSHKTNHGSWGLDRLIIIFILLCLNGCGLTGDLCGILNFISAPKRQKS